MHPELLRARLRTANDLNLEGIGRGEIARQVRDGALVKVHRGWYADAEHWASAFVEERHLMQVIAVHGSGRSGPTMFFSSAAVAWGLPLFRHQPRSVHVVGAANDGQVRPGRLATPDRARSPRVAHHDIALAPEDVCDRFGVVCTTLERTVYDMIRLTRRETAIAVADAALRLVAWDPGERRYDEHAAEEWRAGLERRIRRSKGARGIRQARSISADADGRSENPGESVSRMYLHDLGFSQVVPQVPVAAPGGSFYHVDFGFGIARVWGEFDGEQKYTDPRYLRGRTRDEAMRDEKRREDWIRGTTGRPLVRWGMQELASAAVLGAHLRSFGVHP